MKSHITSPKNPKTAWENAQTSDTRPQLTSRPFAPISKQTTSTPIPDQQQEQTQGLLQRKTNLLAIPGLTAAPKKPIQAKLTIGETKDKYEQEADTVARQVVQRLHTPMPEPKPSLLMIQRMKAHTLERSRGNQQPGILTPKTNLLKQPIQMKQNGASVEVVQRASTPNSQPEHSEEQDNPILSGRLASSPVADNQLDYSDVPNESGQITEGGFQDFNWEMFNNDFEGFEDLIDAPPDLNVAEQLNEVGGAESEFGNFQDIYGFGQIDNDSSQWQIGNDFSNDPMMGELFSELLPNQGQRSPQIPNLGITRESENLHHSRHSSQPASPSVNEDVDIDMDSLFGSDIGSPSFSNSSSSAQQTIAPTISVTSRLTFPTVPVRSSSATVAIPQDQETTTAKKRKRTVNEGDENPVKVRKIVPEVVPSNEVDTYIYKTFFQDEEVQYPIDISFILGGTFLSQYTTNQNDEENDKLAKKLTKSSLIRLIQQKKIVRNQPALREARGFVLAGTATNPHDLINEKAQKGKSKTIAILDANVQPMKPEEARKKILDYLHDNQNNYHSKKAIITEVGLKGCNPQMIIDALNDLVNNRQIAKRGNYYNLEYKFLSLDAKVQRIEREEARKKILDYLGKNQNNYCSKEAIIIGAGLQNCKPKLIAAAFNDLVDNQQIAKQGNYYNLEYKFLSLDAKVQPMKGEEIKKKILDYLHQNQNNYHSKQAIITGAGLKDCNTDMIRHTLNYLVDNQQIAKQGNQNNLEYKFLSLDAKVQEMKPEEIRKKILDYLHKNQNNYHSKQAIITGAGLKDCNTDMIRHTLNYLVNNQQIAKQGNQNNLEYKFLSLDAKVQEMKPEEIRKKILDYLHKNQNNYHSKQAIITGAGLKDYDTQMIKNAFTNLVNNQQIAKQGNQNNLEYKFLSLDAKVQEMKPEEIRKKILDYLHQKQNSYHSKQAIITGAELQNCHQKMIINALTALANNQQIAKRGNQKNLEYKFLSLDAKIQPMKPEEIRKKILDYLYQNQNNYHSKQAIITGAELQNCHQKMIIDAFINLVNNQQIAKQGNQKNLEYKFLLSAKSGSQQQKLSYIVSEAAQETLRQLQLENQDIQPDGDCLYNALIHMGVPYASVNEFRNALADFATQNYQVNDVLKSNVDDSGQSLTQFTDDIRAPGSFANRAGDVSTTLISMFLNINIIVINQDGSTTPASDVSGDPYYLVRFINPSYHFNATKSQEPNQ